MAANQQHDNHAFEEELRSSSSGCSTSNSPTGTMCDHESSQESSNMKTVVTVGADGAMTIANKVAGATATTDSQSYTSDRRAGSPPTGGQFTISWDNLDYVVESKWYKLATNRTPILNGLSGTIRSGELSAILGPSGAGKSTLIDCIMGKKDRGLRGRTKVSFEDPDWEQLRRRKRPLKIALIPQEDHLLESLTVTETFMFASKIKNAHLAHEEDEYIDYMSTVGQQPDADKRQAGAKRKPFDHFANVQRVIQQLNLSSCASQRCGKLSGGQYKRVSIGQELLSSPDLLILDEPTSGLDSVTCFQTINALRKLIDGSPYPMAIVATIHQPDVDVFNLFHRAYVLASGGRAIFEGPTDAIFDGVQAGLELVNCRRKSCAWQRDSSAAENSANLRRQLEQRNCNPARLIVEVAANEYGFEIISAMNELQRGKGLQQYDSCLSISDSFDGSESSQQPAAGITVLVGSKAKPDGASTINLVPMDGGAGTTAKPPSYDYAANHPATRRPDLDQLLNLIQSNTARKRSLAVYWRHLLLHTQRSWVTILRDPMLFTLQVLLHILVPLLISYAFQGQRGDACPLVGPLNVVDEAFRSGNILDDLNRELRTAFENLGYMFFQIYVIIFAAVCVTSLTYPLAMHVLLKEYRNGWYSMSSYFLGRTLADLPVPTFNVTLAMFISYHLTGQPASLYQWRFASVASLTVLATLVAQTQGLMFGALLMNAPQSAVFVAPASTAPLVVVSGFLIRIKSLPFILQVLSQFSYFTHLLNGFIVSIYGYGRCPCKESDFLPDDEHKIPAQARTIIDIWVETFKPEYEIENSTQLAQPTDLVGKLVDTISIAKTFGHNMTECSQVKPFTMLDYSLEDADLQFCFMALIAMLIFFRWLTYAVLTWKIRSCI